MSSSLPRYTSSLLHQERRSPLRRVMRQQPVPQQQQTPIKAEASSVKQQLAAAVACMDTVTFNVKENAVVNTHTEDDEIATVLPTQRPIVVSMLNNKGASYIENRNWAKASKSLTKALRMAAEESAAIDNRHRTKKQQRQEHTDDSMTPFSNSDNNTNSSDGNPTTPYWQPKKELSSLALYGSTIESSDDNSKNPFKHRAEYDEGMDYCNKPLRLNDNSRNIEGCILFNLGRLQHDQGNFDEALVLYKRALKSVEQICGDEEGCHHHHDEPLTLALLISVGQIQYIRGDHADSLKTYQTSLSLSVAAFGKDSLQVAACMNCIGVLHYIMQEGDSNLAMRTLKKSLAIRVRKLGNSHIDVGTTWNNIGRIFFQKGEYEDAMQGYQKALRIRRHVQGESVDVAATLFNIGQVFHQLSAREEALAHYRAFLLLAKEHFGEFHRDVCIVTTCMGQVYHEMKEYDEALKSFHRALDVGKIALGEIHSEVAITLNKLGNLYYETGDLEAALKSYHQGLKVEIAVLEESNPNVIITYTNIAEIHKQRAEYAAAHDNYNKVLELQRKYASDPLEIANTLSSIGYVRHQHGDFHGALEVNQECLSIRREANGDHDEDVAQSLVHIALVLIKMDASKMALELLTEAYRIRKSLNNPGQQQSEAFILYNIALIYQHQGSHETALRYYLETARVEREALGEGHRDLSITKFNIAQCFYSLGELGLAVKQFHEALVIERSHFGNSHPTCARTLNEIGNIELQRGNVEGVMACYSEALAIYREAGIRDDQLVVFGRNLWRFEVVHPRAAGAA